MVVESSDTKQPNAASATQAGNPAFGKQEGKKDPALEKEFSPGTHGILMPKPPLMDSSNLSTVDLDVHDEGKRFTAGDGGCV